MNQPPEPDYIKTCLVCGTDYYYKPKIQYSYKEDDLCSQKCKKIAIRQGYYTED